MCKLYHYCSEDVFIKIISNKCIRLSNVCKSNDDTERIWALKKMEQTLLEFLIKENVYLNTREDYPYDKDIKNNFEYLISEIEYYHDSPSLVTCFCQNGDLAGMWREYADQARGLSIGFDFFQLDKISGKKSNLELRKVLYDETSQVHEIEFQAYKALQYTRVRAKYFLGHLGFKGDISDEMFNMFFQKELETFGEVFARYMLDSCSKIKNPDFIEEEWRIYYNTCIETDDGKIIDYNYIKSFYKYDLMPMDYYKKNGREVEYADLSFARKVDDGLIKEIIIGSDCSLSESDIRKVLSDYGYNTTISIKKSETNLYQ